jgi:hypothetical protein
MLESKKNKMEEDQKARNNMLTQMFPSLIAQHMLAKAGTEGGTPLSTPVGEFSMVQPPTDYSKLNEQSKFMKENDPSSMMFDTLLKSIGTAGTQSMSTANMMSMIPGGQEVDQKVIIDNQIKNMEYVMQLQQQRGAKKPTSTASPTSAAPSPSAGAEAVKGTDIVKVRNKKTGKVILARAEGLQSASDAADWEIIK